jgi:hypothetical protein
MLAKPVPATVQYSVFTSFDVWLHTHLVHNAKSTTPYDATTISVVLRRASLLAANAEGYDQDWAIEPMEISSSKELRMISFFRYSVPTLINKECSVRLFEEDCITVGGRQYT